LIELEKESRLENNYKDYSDKVLRRLEVIRKIKDYGFTLIEIKAMIDLHESGLLKQERGRKYVESKLVRVQKKIDELEQIKETMISLINEPIQSCTLKQILNELEGYIFFLFPRTAKM